MKTSKNAESTTTKPTKDASCRIDIHIESQGDVNIYNCTPPGSSSEPCPPPKDDHDCPPVAPGACVPVSLGSKPKQSRRSKLDKLLANTRVPSALGASFFHLTRRYLAARRRPTRLRSAPSPRYVGFRRACSGCWLARGTRSTRCPEASATACSLPICCAMSTNRLRLFS